MISCCGITLPPQEPETPDQEHEILVEQVEDEYYARIEHPMTKDHYISFLAAASNEGMQFVKLYPEGSAAARFKRRRVQYIYACCNRHGLFQISRKEIR